MKAAKLLVVWSAEPGYLQLNRYLSAIAWVEQQRRQTQKQQGASETVMVYLCNDMVRNAAPG